MTADEPSETRAHALFEENLWRLQRRADAVFVWLTLAQWAVAIAMAICLSPRSWSGSRSSLHLHVYLAVFMGAALSIPVLLLVRFRRGAPVTRVVIAVATGLWSALLIHLSGGRIETHFYIFGSLAFISFYRDWRLLLVATVIVAADHLGGVLYWGRGMYGLADPGLWRFAEHVGWVVFENVVLFMLTFQTRNEMTLLAERQAAMEEGQESIEQAVTRRTTELVRSREQYRRLVENTRAIPWEYNIAEQRLTYMAPQAAALLGCAPGQVTDQEVWMNAVVEEDRERLFSSLPRAMSEGVDVELEYRVRHTDGTIRWLHSLIGGAERDPARVRGFYFDVSDRHALETELQQAQKLESVGRLASGIAHEINTPIQFVGDSVHFASGAYDDLLKVVKCYRALGQACAIGGEHEELIAAIDRAEEDADLDYLEENLPKAMSRALEGLERVAGLVRSMKEFAHPEQHDQTFADLNHALNTTLTIARNEYKYVADVETDLGELPHVLCHVSQLNQVFLNLIVNAAHAISDVAAQTGQRGRIKIRTRLVDGHAQVSIEDTGPGIPEAIRGKIFDPFFTTKAVGKGTGQGLAIAHNVVVDKHHGTLLVESEVGRGTTFHVRVPVNGVPVVAVAA
jgi:PAS domain S-box-containing protein